MLLINGALAAWNGVLAATGKFWCECVRGGTCCGGECRCDEGTCCGGVWHPDSDPDGPCGANHFFAPEYGINFTCCGCLPNQLEHPILGTVNTQDVLGELCCGCVGESSYYLGPCSGRCCTDGDCSQVREADCLGTWFADTCCSELGCPKSCCTEGSDGVTTCTPDINELECDGVADDEPCESACKGACCIDGELTEGSPTTQAECEGLGGCWYGVGSTQCGEGFCRAPFDEDCCEHVISSAASITFTGPRKRRCPEFDGCGFSVTVSVTTGQPVYVHGGQFGNPYEACTDITTFSLCNDTFRVTPAPCTGNLDKLDIEVCWDDGSGPELLRFYCCAGTYLLGNCECDCVTTLLYEGTGCTSAAALQLNGDAIIDASGTGPLVLTANITHGGSCDRKLTLTGTSTADNELSGEIQNGPSDTDVEKIGIGLWRLSGNSSYAGQLKVLDGTLVIAAAVNELGSSPFGDSAAPRPVIGNPAAGATGTAALLVLGGVLSDTSGSIDRTFSVAAIGSGASQIVVLGTTGTGDAIIGTTSTDIRLGRSVTLQASNASTGIFLGRWRDLDGNTNPVVGYTIGSVGNSGVVRLRSVLSAAATGVDIVNGTAQVANTDVINLATPVTIQGATLDIKAQSGSISQRLGNVTFTGSFATIESSDSSGTLKLDSGSTATVTVSGTGHEISLPVELLVNSTFNVGSGGKLVVSGNITGSGDLEKTGSGTLELSGTIAYTGETDIQAGTLIVNQEFAGSADISKVTFTPTTLTVAFTVTPTSGATYRLVGGTTAQTYATVTLTGAGGATGTYNSANSTLTIT